MKKNDIALLILIASISLAAAWFIGNAVIGEPKQKDTKIKTAEVIVSDVVKPSSTIFNSDAVNPRVERSIGESSNELPLTSQQQTE